MPENQRVRDGHVRCGMDQAARHTPFRCGHPLVEIALRLDDTEALPFDFHSAQIPTYVHAASGNKSFAFSYAAGSIIPFHCCSTIAAFPCPSPAPLFNVFRGNELLPRGLPISRKSLERKGEVWRGKGNLSPERFPSPNPIASFPP